ncbi:MAG: MBL fold metallo-hydrolase [Proteobacteria bacterium]|nr:MBL fold metallo-hydrolase [Pseudomonadota bacterium]
MPERRLGERLFEVAPDVYRIPLPTDFNVGDINVYFIDGPDAVLIDAGVSGERNLSTLAGALSIINRKIEVVNTLLVTHTHVDHAGGAKTIKEASGCEVFLHRRARPWLSDPHGRWKRDSPWYSRFMEQSGFGGETLAKFNSHSPMFLRYTEPCPDLQIVGSGDVLHRAGGRPIAVHEAFGHTTTQIVFQLLDSNILFSADHVLAKISANPTMAAPRRGDESLPPQLSLYQESLHRIAELKASLACPGHGSCFADIVSRCEAITQHQQRRCTKVLDIVRAQGPISRKEISRQLFGPMPLTQLYLTISEVKAAVELLQYRGDILAEVKDEVVLFGAA